MLYMPVVFQCCTLFFDDSCRKVSGMEVNINAATRISAVFEICVWFYLCVIIIISVHFHDFRDYTCTEHCDAVLQLYAEGKTFLPITLVMTGWNLSSACYSCI